MSQLLDIYIDRGWTSNDFAAFFAALAEVNAILQSLQAADSYAVSTDSRGHLTFRRKPIPDSQQVRIHSISFSSPGDVRIEVPLGGAIDAIHAWGKDAAWREQLERLEAAEHLKRDELETARERMRLIDDIFATADRLGVPPEELASHVIPKLAKSVRVLDRLRHDGLLQGLEVV